MLYIEARCPHCAVDVFGFCRHLDNTQLGLLCNQCYTLYPNPQSIGLADGCYPLHEAIRDGELPHWASQKELDLRGWLYDSVGKWVASD